MKSLSLLFIFVSLFCCASCMKRSPMQTIGVRHYKSDSIIVHSIEGVRMFGDIRDGTGENHSLLETEYESHGKALVGVTTWINPVILNFPVEIRWAYTKNRNKTYIKKFNDIINREDYDKDKGLNGSVIFVFYKNKWYMVWVSDRKTGGYVPEDAALYMIVGKVIIWQ